MYHTFQYNFRYRQNFKCYDIREELNKLRNIFAKKNPKQVSGIKLCRYFLKSLKDI